MKTNIQILTRLFCFGFVFLLSSGFTNSPDLDTKIMNYVDQYKDLAIAESERTGIPASIKLAQAVLESRFGTSDLATKANNHFGIKCKIDWKGEKVFANDDTPSDCFRKYTSAHESFIDHSDFLKSHRLHFYDHLFEIDKRDYKAWASGLQIAGYASTNYYAKTLIYLIEKYEFYQYDDGEKAWALNTDERMALSEKAQNVYYLQINVPKQKPVEEIVEEPAYSRIHILKDGESMESIAQQYEVNVDSFYNRNELIYGSQPTTGSVLYLDALTKRKPELNIVFYDRTVVGGGENTYSTAGTTKMISTPVTNSINNTEAASTISKTPQKEVKTIVSEVSSLAALAENKETAKVAVEKPLNTSVETSNVENFNKTKEEKTAKVAVEKPIVEKPLNTSVKTSNVENFNKTKEEVAVNPKATIDNAILDIVVSKKETEIGDSLTVPNKEQQAKYTIENIWQNQTEKPKDRGTQ